MGIKNSMKLILKLLQAKRRDWFTGELRRDQCSERAGSGRRATLQQTIR